MVMGRLGGGSRRYIGITRWRVRVENPIRDFRRAVETRQVLKRDDHGAHHVVVFVIKDVTVPDVTRPCRRVKWEYVLPGLQVGVVRVLQCQADQHSRDHERRGQDDVLPSVLARELAGGYRGTRHAGLGKVVCSAEGAVLRVKLEVTDTKHTGRVARVRRRSVWIVGIVRIAELHRILHIDSDRWMIERKSRVRPIQFLKVGQHAVGVNSLPVFQLELDQVNVDGMGILREVLDVPLFCRAHSGDFRDILMESASVDENMQGIAREKSTVRAFLLVQREELWIADVRGWSERGNADQFCWRRIRMHSLGVLYGELHDHTGVGIGGIATRVGRNSVVRQYNLSSCRKIGEVDEDVDSLTDCNELVRHGDGRAQEAAVAADLYKGNGLPGCLIHKGQAVEARVGAIDDAEPVLAPLHVQVRPYLAVDHDLVAKVLGIPIRMEIRVVADGGEMNGAVAVESPIRQHERPLELPRGKER